MDKTTGQKKEISKNAREIREIEEIMQKKAVCQLKIGQEQKKIEDI